MCHFHRLWNGMFDRHQAEITVMQFTGHSLSVHQSVTVPWHFNPVPYCQPSSPTPMEYALPPSLEWHVWRGRKSIYNRSPKRWRRPGVWSSAKPDSQQQVPTADSGQCGRSSWGSLYNVSLVLFCHGGQWRVLHTRLSWAGDAPAPFWRHSVPSTSVISAIWPLGCWFLPDQEPQRTAYTGNGLA